MAAAMSSPPDDRQAWHRFRTPAPYLSSTQWEDAAAVMRWRATADALLIFIVGFTLDDLHVLRFPGWLAFGATALVVLAAGPLWYGRRTVLSYPKDADDDAIRYRLDIQRRVGKLYLMAAAVIFVAWMVVFTAGVPPWAR